jgi:hypothetical protein
VITPPDIVSQLALAIPMCLLYEVGIWAALKPQTPAVIGVQRGDRSLELKVTVAQRPKTMPRRGEQR